MRRWSSPLVHIKDFLRLRAHEAIERIASDPAKVSGIFQNLDLQSLAAIMARLSSARFIDECMANARPLDSREEVLIQATRIARPGTWAEFGVYKGESLRMIAEVAPNCHVFGFDSFEGLPEDWRDGFPAGKFRIDPHQIGTLPANCTLMPGLFTASIPVFLSKSLAEITFLHIDCDLFSSTQDVFSLLGSRLAKDCVIVFDEYFNYPGWRQGEHRAFEEFLSASGRSMQYRFYNRWHEQVAVVLT